MANIMYVVKFSDEAFSNIAGALEDFIASKEKMASVYDKEVK